MNNEWPLIFFTLFAQMAWGLVVAIASLRLGKQFELTMVFSRVRGPAILVSIVLMTAALLISFFHLGSPLKAVYALCNLKSSWLSREILAVSVFWALLIVWYVIMKRAKGKEAFSKTMLWLCFVAGLVMVYTMARLYMVPAIPAWNLPSTMISFYTSSLMLGPAFLLLLIVIRRDPGISNIANQYFFRILVGVLLVSLIIRLTGVTVFPLPAGEDVFAPPALPGWLGVMHYFFLIGGVVMILIFAIFSAGEISRPYTGTILFSFVCIFLAEVILRYMFYAGYYRLGV